MHTNRFETRHAGIALTVLLSAALSLPANAAEIWKVDLAKSTFGSGANTLVLERASGKATQGMELKGTPAPGTFLVISNGKIYLAADESASDATSSTGVRTVDYTAWKDMKLVQIGDKVRSADYCGFACQSGLPDRRMTLTFTAKGDRPQQADEHHSRPQQIGGRDELLGARRRRLLPALPSRSVTFVRAGDGSADPRNAPHAGPGPLAAAIASRRARPRSISHPTHVLASKSAPDPRSARERCGPERRFEPLAPLKPLFALNFAAIEPLHGLRCCKPRSRP